MLSYTLVTTYFNSPQFFPVVTFDRSNVTDLRVAAFTDADNSLK
jgi:hypothetical protein